jgi:hypothetical protein
MSTRPVDYAGGAGSAARTESGRFRNPSPLPWGEVTATGLRAVALPQISRS